jgi:hypothetical protein
MQWDRSKTIGLAKVSCSYCHGYGLRFARKGKEIPCQCVFRAIFRACLNRFQECVEGGHHTSTVTLEYCRGAERQRVYSRKREEFMADFCLVSDRALDEIEQKVFRYHFLLGADCRLCCRQLRMDRGTFYHFVYKIQETLGRTFAELEPYALFPLDEYFSGMVRRKPTLAAQAFTPPHLARNSNSELPLSA